MLFNKTIQYFEGTKKTLYLLLLLFFLGGGGYSGDKKSLFNCKMILSINQ